VSLNEVFNFVFAVPVPIDETNPATTDQTAVLIAGSTEVFVAPKPRQTRSKDALPAPSSLTAAIDSVSKAANGAAATAGSAISSIKQATSTQTESANLRQQPTRVEANNMSDTPTGRLRVIPPRIARQWPDVIHRIKMRSNLATPVGFVSAPTHAKLLIKFAGVKAWKGIQDDQFWVEILEIHKRRIPDAESEAAVMDSTTSEGTDQRGKRVLLLPLHGIKDDHVIIGNPLDANAEMQAEGYRNIR
jgi:hypothetical protein